MSAWYRNETWSEEIAADFERRLARSRGQKAQNLSLQGYHLMARYPAVARDLLRRAVELDDAFETPRALSFLAVANLALGDVDGALEVYEAALERQVEQPEIVAVQPADYLFVVGVFEREDRLAAAGPIADALPDEGLFGPDAQALAAKALVFALSGRAPDARRCAALALPLMADLPHVTAAGIDVADLRRRLEALAGEAA